MDQFLSLSCVVSDGDLPLHIFWTFNQQPLTIALDVSVAKLGKRSSVLTIESVSGQHAGNYSCHAENRAGNTSFTTELKVIGVSYFLDAHNMIYFVFEGIVFTLTYNF